MGRRPPIASKDKNVIQSFFFIVFVVLPSIIEFLLHNRPQNTLHFFFLFQLFSRVYITSITVTFSIFRRNKILFIFSCCFTKKLGLAVTRARGGGDSHPTISIISLNPPYERVPRSLPRLLCSFFY